MANQVPSVASAIKLAATDLHQVPSVTSAIKCQPRGRAERVLVADDEEPLVRLADRNPPGARLHAGPFRATKFYRRHLAYSNFGIALIASFVAPGRTSLPSTRLSKPTGIATSCTPKPRKPPALTMA